MTGTVATSLRMRILFDTLRAHEGRWIRNGELIRALHRAGAYTAALHSDIADLRRDPALSGWIIPPAARAQVEDPDGSRRMTYLYTIHRAHRRPPPRPGDLAGARKEKAQ